MSNFQFTRPDAFPPIVKNLIIINVLVFLAQVTLGTQYSLTERIALYPIIDPRLNDLAVLIPGLQPYIGFHPYQIATHMFAHGGISHILFNMFGLYMFGRILENVWGPKRFLLFYIICGVGAAVAHMTIGYIRTEQLLDALLISGNGTVSLDAISPEAINLIPSLAPALGASGAIMGIFAAFAYLFPNTELYIMFIPFPIKAKYAVIGFAAIDLFGGVARISGDNVAHFAHLGGALTGFILVLIWNKRNRRRFY